MGWFMNVVDAVVGFFDNLFHGNSGESDVELATEEECKEAINEKETQVSAPPVDNACVICMNAMDSEPLHIKKGEILIEMNSFSQLNKNDIELEKEFKKCEMDTNKKCTVKKTDIEGQRWWDVDTVNDQGVNIRINF